MKKVLIILVTVLLVLTSVISSFAQDDTNAEKKIMFINVMRSLEFFQNIEAMVKKTSSEMGYSVDTLDVNVDYELTAEYIAQAITQRYDAIMICGDESLISSAEEAMAAGVAVINYDAWIGTDNISARVASDNYAMGLQMGEYAVELLKQKNGEAKGTVLYMNYTYSTLADRAMGFVKAFEAYPDITLKEIIPTNPDDIDASANSAENTLTANPEGSVDIFFGPNTGTSLGILSAAESANRKDIIVLGVDDEEGQINALLEEDGIYNATIAQDPFAIGKACVDSLASIFDGETGLIIAADSVLVTRDNVAEYIANRELTLEELSDWK